MEVFNGSETVTIKEEPIDTTSFPTDCGTTVNYGQFCSVQYAEGCPDGQPQADLVDPLLKTEPPDSSGACCSNAIKKEEVVEPVETDPLVNTYSTKCELICAAENVEHKEPQPTPSTSAASKAEDNFEFISVGAIKQEEPEWTSDTEPVHPNPLQETVKEDPEPTLQQDHDPGSCSNAGHSRSEGLECGLCQKKCRQKTHLAGHITSHDRRKLYHCRVCRRRFSRMTSLLAHNRIHSREEAHSCGICEKHAASHTAESETYDTEVINVEDETEATGSTSRIRRLPQPIPHEGLRKDQSLHMPEMMNRKQKSRSRCRNVGCNHFTYVHCTTCKVFLCFSTERNCFLAFHKS